MRREEFWKSLEQFLTEDKGGKKRKIIRKVNPKEEIRRKLEERARKELEKYQQDLFEAKEVAIDKLSQVILPWWKNDIINSGFYTRLLQIRDGKRLTKLLLNDPIIYFWPQHLFKDLRSSTNKPFNIDAEFALEEVKSSKGLLDTNQEIERRIRKYLAEKWLSNIYFLPFGSKLGNGLNIVTEPEVQPRGLYTSPIYIHEPLVFKGEQTVLPKVHPQAIVDFAAQIEDERIWTRLEKSIRGRK